MSIYVEGILPYPFTDIKDTVKATAEISAIRERLMAYFHVNRGFNLEIDNFDDNPECDYENRYRIANYLNGIDIELGNGFLLLDCGYNHSQYFYITNGITWLRNDFYDIVKALGFSEIYIVDENHGSDRGYKCGREIGDYDFTFDDWRNEFSEIPILEETLFHKWSDNPWPEIGGVYLERFYGSIGESKRIATKFPDIKFLTTAPICGKYYLVLVDGILKLFNAEGNSFLRCGDFDGIECRFNYAGFLLFKGKRAAFYNLYGKRLTPFRVKQKIEWEWSRTLNRAINIYDKIRNRLIYTQEL